MSTLICVAFNGLDAKYDCRNGNVYTDNLNEELDQEEIIIEHLETELQDVHRLDLAIVYKKDGDDAYEEIGRYVISKIIRENTRAINEAKQYYKYTISLVSETKNLENTKLPNVSITQNLDGTGKTVYQKIVEYINLYSEKKRTANGYVNDFQLSNVPLFSSYTENAPHVFGMVCPEMQWNQPTLRDVITDLMLVADCIPIAYNHFVYWIDLKARGNSFDKTAFDTEITQEDENDYASDIYSTIDNVLQSNVKDVDNTVNCCEYIGFRVPSGEYQLSENSMILKTSNPIVRISRVTAIIQLKSHQLNRASSFISRKCEIDLTPIIFEKDAHDTMSVYGTTNAFTQLKWEDFKTYANFSLYYTRGSDSIEGFGQSVKGVMTDSTMWKTFLDFLTTANSYHLVGINVEYSNFTPSSILPSLDVLRYVTFKVEYETLANCSAKVGRYIGSKHKKEVTDNQKNSYVDAYREGMFEYSKVNRLGNAVRVLSGRFADFADIPPLGATNDGGVVYKRVITFDRNHYQADLYLTEGYILKSYFTGVRSKVRTYAIAQSSEALLRHDIDKTYLEFSFSRKTDSNYPFANKIGNEAVCRYFLSPLETFTSTMTINAVTVQFYLNNKTSYTDVFQAELISRVFGNSLLFMWKATDNYEIGQGMEEKDLGQTPFALIKNPYRYCDENGNADSCEVTFYHSIESDYGNNGDIVYYSEGSANAEKMQGDSLKRNNLTKIDPAHITYLGKEFSYERDLEKDQREITAITKQFEFCADTNNIYFSNLFINKQRAISKTRVTPTAPTARVGSYTLYSSNFNATGVPASEHKNKSVLVQVYRDDATRLAFYTSTDDGSGNWSWVFSEYYPFFDISNENFFFAIEGRAGVYFVSQKYLDPNQDYANPSHMWDILQFPSDFSLGIDTAVSLIGADTTTIVTSDKAGKLMVDDEGCIYLFVADSTLGTVIAYVGNTNAHLVFTGLDGKIYSFYNGKLTQVETRSLKIYGYMNTALGYRKFGNDLLNTLEGCVVNVGATASVSTIDKYSCSVTLNGAGTYDSYAITDADGNILLAWNGGKTLYLNILGIHNDDIYDSYLDKVVGNIRS